MPKGVKVLDDRTDAAVESLSTPRGDADPNLAALSTGVVLRARPVPASLFADLMARYPTPEPPVVFIPEKGREEENPDDPGYTKRVTENNAQLARAMADAVILLGTEIASVPRGFPDQDDPEWLEEARLLGYELHSKRAKYLAWVKFKAGPELSDYQALWKAVGRLTGVTEQDTQAAVQRFPGRARRNGHH